MNRFFRHIINWWKIKFRLKKGDHFSCRLNYIYNLMRDLTYGERLMSTIRRRQRRRQCQTMHILHMLHTLHYTYARAQSNVVHVVRNLLFNVIYCRHLISLYCYCAPIFILFFLFQSGPSRTSQTNTSSNRLLLRSQTPNLRSQLTSEFCFIADAFFSVMHSRLNTT